MADLRQRPDAPTVLKNLKEHIRLVAVRANVGLPKDGTHEMQAPLRLKPYTVATLPTASLWTDSMIAVSDETGGHTVAFSDGTNWRRVQDRAVVS